MAYFFHGTIRKYTSALLELFNDIEIQYNTSAGIKTKKIPLKYAAREKCKVFDEHTTEQLLSGNYSVLPRASLSISAIQKFEQRTKNKNNKINRFTEVDSMEFSYNSVPYEFLYEITVQCRGMNEATQIIEQIAPQFNPTVNIDIWDVNNLSEPTRVPVRLLDVGIEAEEYEELSSNLFTVSFGLSLMGNLYPPIKSQERIQEFQIMINELNGDYYKQSELLEWDVDLDGHIIGGTIDTAIDGTEYNGPPNGTGGGGGPASSLLPAERIEVIDAGNYFDATDVEGVLQEIGEDLEAFEITYNKNQPNGYAGLDASGKIFSNLLPSYVDDVVEYSNFVSLPVNGETGKIYVTINDGAIYRWSGSTYIRISNSVAIADSALKLEFPRTITISGDASGSAVFDGSQDININVQIDGTTIGNITTGNITLGGEIYQPLNINGEYDENGVLTNVSAIWNSIAKYMAGALTATQYDLLMADSNGIFQPTKYIPPAAAITIDCGDY